MIGIKNMTKRFGDFTALQGVNCEIGGCSIYGLVGYNGSGKTTLLKTVAGIYRPEEGKVLLEGENVYDNDTVKKSLVFVPDEPYFTAQATMKGMARLYQGFYPSFQMSTFTKLAGLFGLDVSKRINSFSKGMQRQAAIVLALAAHPKYILLDESFDGLDPVKRNLVKKLLLDYMAENDTSVLISSHNLRELEDLCDHIALLNNHAIVLDCSVDEMRADRSKFRVAFDREIKPEDFSALPCKNLEISGRIATFVASGSPELVEEKIKALSPAFIEALPMTLEEIFLDEMEAVNYDYAEIFEA